MLQTRFANVPPDIRELRLRRDAGFGYQPLLQELEDHRACYAVVARLTVPLKRRFPGLAYEHANARWQLAETEYRALGWPHARPIVVARRFTEKEDAQTTLFAVGRYLYRAWTTNLDLPPVAVWRFYEGRAAMEPRFHELRKTALCERFPLLRLRPTRCTWKSSAWPTILSPLSSGLACPTPGKVVSCRNFASSYSCSRPNSLVRTTAPPFASGNPLSSNGWQKVSSPRSLTSTPWTAAENDHLHAGFKWDWVRCTQAIDFAS